jgi:hypothetical protein
MKVFIAKNGFCPTLAELAKMANVSNNAVAERIDALIKKGWVIKRFGATRGLIPVAMKQDTTADHEDGSSDETRHPIYLTTAQLLHMQSRLSSPSHRFSNEDDDLLTLIKGILDSSSDSQENSAF